MEVNFDKEMDALLRQTARQQTTAGPPLAEAHLPPESHMDADTMAAFSANALPVKARERAMGHLVDCGTCRTIISNLVFFENEEEESKAAFAATSIAAPTVKEASLVDRIFSIFKFPTLAYGMAALALVFAGGIGIMVWQSAASKPQMASLSKDEAIKPAQAVAEQNETGLAANYSGQVNSNSAANSVASAANAAFDGAIAVPSAAGSGYGMTSTMSESNAAAIKTENDQPASITDSKLKAAEPMLSAPASGAAPSVMNAAPAPPKETMKQLQELPAGGRQVQNSPTDQINTQQRQDNYRYNNNILTPDGAGNDRSRRGALPDTRALSNEARDEEEKAKDDSSAPDSAAAAGKTAGKPVDKDAKAEQKKSAEKKNKKRKTASADAEVKAKPAATPTPKKPDDEEKFPW